MVSEELQNLIKMLSKLPGLGPRSGRRVALHLIKNEALIRPLANSLLTAAERIQTCMVCGNLDSLNPCSICSSAFRDASTLCIVQDVADLWAMERSATYKGRYHVLGGTLSALDGVGPDQLHIPQLMERLKSTPSIQEVILALNLTVDGQTT
ncbi:MAG: recombination protein RecR, partial [Alphaproteobacteria bacterium]|nr:recombination protein RecR [Alphaproteobacteria bacterium]